MRVILALLLLAAAVAGGVFFAGNPGHVAIQWLGREYDTSVGVLVAAVAAVAVVVMLLALAIAALRRVPRNVRRRRADRRRRAGEMALTNGLVALAAGDAAEARRHATRASALLVDGSPTALLLTAEAAQRQGDTAAARQAYTELSARPDSEFLGLRGLIAQALRSGDDTAARRLAERARQLRPATGWIAENLVLLQARAGDWAAARDTLAGAVRRGAVPADIARHQRGVVLYELSRDAERQGSLREAAGLAAKAQGLAPDLAPIVAHHARLLVALGRHRAAAKAIERAWRRAPHPDLARAYADLQRTDASALGRASALQRLATQNPDAAESHLAVAEAALDAQLWGEARRHLDLAAAGTGESRRFCLLMARLEESGTSDLAAARRWLDRAIAAAAASSTAAAPPDACYVCDNCGSVSPDWRPLCAVCGGFDRLGWRLPTRSNVEIVPTVGITLLETTGAGAAPHSVPSTRRPGASRLAATPQSDK